MIQLNFQKIGKWLRFNNETSMCSVCGQRVLTNNIEHYKYCFNCGIKMKEVENMKLIIDIPKEKYDWIMSHLTLDRNFRECKITPLPKGHGDLIDSNVLCEQYEKTYGDLYQALDLTPIIIEADKG